jgi:hypothetical protein
MTNQDRSAEKPVEEWVTGDEPMTGPQRSYLETLGREAGREIPDQLTKAEASELIERLQRETGRGEPSDGRRPQGNAPVDELIDEGIVDQQASAVIEPDR